jgi:hypothetical protein
VLLPKKTIGDLKTVHKPDKSNVTAKLLVMMLGLVLTSMKDLKKSFKPEIPTVTTSLML